MLLRHILEHTRSSRDPDARTEGIAYCGYSEELSWSGQGTQALQGKLNDKDVCPTCKKLYIRDMREEEDEDSY
jgi:hypothetical protein